MTYIRGSFAPATPSSASSASTRSWATANGPSWNSKPIRRRIELATAAGTAPGPRSSAIDRAIDFRTATRKVPVPMAGSTTVTVSVAKPSGSPKRPRSDSSANLVIASTTSAGV